MPVDILSIKLYAPKTNPPFTALDPIISQMKLMTELRMMAWAVPITPVARNKNIFCCSVLDAPCNIPEAKMERRNLSQAILTPKEGSIFRPQYSEYPWFSCWSGLRLNTRLATRWWCHGLLSHRFFWHRRAALWSSRWLRALQSHRLARKNRKTSSWTNGTIWKSIESQD